MRTVLLTALAALLLAGCGSYSETGEVKPPDKAYTIAMVPKGTTHEFWKTVEAGARKAEEELGVEVTWKGPLTEDDRNQQIQVVNDFIGKVDAIALAPLDSKGLRGPVKAANDAGTPVIIFDSGIEDSDIVSFVATDNRAAGAKAGAAMAERLGGKGKVVVMRYSEGSASTTEREEGFIAAAKAGGLEIVSDEQYAGVTSEDARQTAGRLIQRFSGAGGMTVQGVFAPNESSAFGMLLALQESGMAGKVAFYGFDSNEKLLEGVRAGHVEGLVLQDPFNMGYLTVKTIVAHLKGEKVEPMTDTGSTLVTKENLDSDAVKKLLNPLG
jgi:ribose transport system substrate-binding protein